MLKTDGIFNSLTLNRKMEYSILTMNEKIHDVYLLYVQDGKDYLELGKLERAVKSLVKLEPLLAHHLMLVCIHPGDSIERWDSFHRKGSSFFNYLDFMYNEFIPYIENPLKYCKMQIKKRGLLGDSLAGNICLNIALKQKEYWSHLLLQSAAVSSEDILQLKNIKLPQWNVYQTVGIFEDDFISPISNEKLMILTQNRELFACFQDKNINIHYSEKPEQHLWEAWKKDLPNLLNYFFMNR